MSSDLGQLTDLLHSVQSGISELKHNKRALDRLFLRASTLLDTCRVYVESHPTQDGSVPTSIRFHLESLTAFLTETNAVVQKASKDNFMHTFVNREIIVATIAELNNELNMLVNDVSMLLHIETREWAIEDQDDRKLDKEDMDQTLQHLVDNDYKILNALELKQVEYLEAIDALQKHITEHVDQAIERNIERIFLDKALASLRRATNATRPVQQVPPAEWVLTSWEFEMGPLISRGGFGEVYKAKWLGHTTVAIKSLHFRLETSKLRDDFLREVKTWYPLRHPHILPLLGACATAERPFMVSPFCERGHALQYLEWCTEEHQNPEPFGIKLLYEVSLGMQYLHARGVSHGDLKAVNVLVDEFGKAMVADFGFAALKRYTTTKTAAGGGSPFGGPERLQGSKLAPSVDVYAFSMTCYEVLTDGEVPFTETPDALIYQHVVNNHIRPVLPDTSNYQVSKEKVFSLMEQCWSADPLARPPFSMISSAFRTILGSVNESESTKLGTSGSSSKVVERETIVTADEPPTTSTVQTMSSVTSDSAGSKKSSDEEPPFSVEKYFSVLPPPVPIPAIPQAPRALPPVPPFVSPFDIPAIPALPPPPPPGPPPAAAAITSLRSFVPPTPPLPPFPPAIARFASAPSIPTAPSPPAAAATAASIQRLSLSNDRVPVDSRESSLTHQTRSIPGFNSEKREILQPFNHLQFISQGPGITHISIVRGALDDSITCTLEILKKRKRKDEEDASNDGNVRVSHQVEGGGEEGGATLEISVLYPVGGGGAAMKKSGGFFGRSKAHEGSTSLRLTVPRDLETFTVTGEHIDVSYEGTSVSGTFGFNVRKGTLTGNIEGYRELRAETDAGTLDLRLRPGIPESINVLRSGKGSVNAFISGFKGTVRTNCYFGQNYVSGLDPDESGTEKQVFIVGAGVGEGTVGVPIGVRHEDVKGKFTSSVTFGTTNVAFIRKL
ncbi:hypothetical protein BDR26DRAFT_862072 [Obelidium mucronatum]|nr:hypothetical protein BDR26DRAFT_862072 [Obelidium mucronatum]